jgi:hypothetical protein
MNFQIDFFNIHISLLTPLATTTMILKWPHMNFHIFFVAFTWDLTFVLILMIVNVSNYIILALGYE